MSEYARLEMQLIALGDSLVHWSDIWYEYRVPVTERPDDDWKEHIFGDHCACCHLSWDLFPDNDVDCQGCPISEHTGVVSCKRTPWEKVLAQADKQYWGDEPPKKAEKTQAKLMLAVETEYAFLADLFFELLKQLKLAAEVEGVEDTPYPLWEMGLWA